MTERYYTCWSPSIPGLVVTMSDATSDGVLPRRAAECYTRVRLREALELLALPGATMAVVPVHVAERDRPDGVVTEWNVLVRIEPTICAYPADRRSEGAWGIEFRSGTWLESPGEKTGGPAAAALRFPSREAASVFMDQREWIALNGGMPKRLED